MYKSKIYIPYVLYTNIYLLHKFQGQERQKSMYIRALVCRYFVCVYSDAYTRIHSPAGTHPHVYVYVYNIYACVYVLLYIYE